MNDKTTKINKYFNSNNKSCLEYIILFCFPQKHSFLRTYMYNSAVNIKLYKLFKYSFCSFDLKKIYIFLTIKISTHYILYDAIKVAVEWTLVIFVP